MTGGSGIQGPNAGEAKLEPQLKFGYFVFSLSGSMVISYSPKASFRSAADQQCSPDIIISDHEVGTILRKASRWGAPCIQLETNHCDLGASSSDHDGP